MIKNFEDCGEGDVLTKSNMLITEKEKRQFRLNCKYINFCARNDIENVKICLSRGANVNWRHGSSQSGLHFCVTNNNEELLDLLLSQPEVDVNIRCMRGWTPLMIACKKGYANIVRRLCQVSEINPNITDKYGDTALFLALYLYHIECVKILRTVTKTNWNMKNRDGEYPIIIVLKEQSMRQIEIILSVPDLDLSVTNAADGRNVAQIAVELRGERSQRAVELLSRDSRVNWNIQDYYGDTPLMDCLRFMQQVDEACCMINTPGVDLNIRSSDGKYVEDFVRGRGLWWEEYRDMSYIYELLSRFTGPRLRMIQRDSRQIGRMFTLQSLSCDAVLVSLISNNKKERKMENLVNRLGNEDITKHCRQILLEARLLCRN